jgi:hypothetical protein
MGNRITALGTIALLLKPHVNLFANRALRESIQRAIVAEIRSVHRPVLQSLEYVRDELLEFPPDDGALHQLARVLTDTLTEQGIK